MGRVVVVGSSNVDLTVVAPRLPAPGETVLGHTFASGPGGKGANQAIAARRLGADVTFLTKLGEDRFGEELRARFEREGLPPAGILSTRDAPTGVALIVVDDAGRNTIAVAPGANALLRPGELRGLAGLFDGVSHLLSQLETPVETFVAAARAARLAGATVVLDPAPARPIPGAAYGLVDLITPNGPELAALTGVATTTEEGIEAAARTLLDRGVRTVLVTLGERGSARFDREGATWMPARPVRALDTTGCGDAFDGALVASLAAGSSIVAAVDLATRAGAFCATWRGALDGLPRRDQLDEPPGA
jgi:ribokinase